MVSLNMLAEEVIRAYCLKLELSKHGFMILANCVSDNSKNRNRYGTNKAFLLGSTLTFYCFTFICMEYDISLKNICVLYIETLLLFNSF